MLMPLLMNHPRQSFLISEIRKSQIIISYLNLWVQQHMVLAKVVNPTQIPRPTPLASLAVLSSFFLP